MAGLYFEEFTVGQTFRHAIRRTVTEADNVFFTALTMNPAAIHLDEQYCKEHTEFGTRVVNIEPRATTQDGTVQGTTGQRLT